MEYILKHIDRLSRYYLTMRVYFMLYLYIAYHTTIVTAGDAAALITIDNEPYSLMM